MVSGINQLLECLLREQKFTGPFDFSPEEQKNFDQLIFSVKINIPPLINQAIGDRKYHSLIEPLLSSTSSECLLIHLTESQLIVMNQLLGINEVLQILSNVLKKHATLLTDENFLTRLLVYGADRINKTNGLRLFQNYILLLVSNCTDGHLLSATITKYLHKIIENFQYNKAVLSDEEITKTLELLNEVLLDDFTKNEEKMTDKVCHPQLLAELKKSSLLTHCVSLIGQFSHEQIKLLIDDKDFTTQLDIISRLENLSKKLILLEPFFDKKTKNFDFLKDSPETQRALLYPFHLKTRIMQAA